MDVKKHGTILFRGLAVVAPAIITGYVVVKALWWLDVTVRNGLHYIGGRPLPGLGIIFGVCVIYLIGALARSWLFGVLIGLTEAAMARIPVVKTVYSAIKDLLQFLGGAKKGGARPAMLKSPDGTFAAIGLITQDHPAKFLPGAEDRVAVYLPMSYQLGGFTMYVPRSAVEELQGVSVEETLKLCLTAGMSAGEDGAPKPPDRPQENP